MSYDTARNGPVCGVDVTQRELANIVVIDFCAEHAIWFDRGELDALPGRRDAAEIAERIARRDGQAIVIGAGWTVGGRFINGVIDSVLGD